MHRCLISIYGGFCCGHSSLCLVITSHSNIKFRLRHDSLRKKFLLTVIMQCSVVHFCLCHIEIEMGIVQVCDCLITGGSDKSSWELGNYLSLLHLASCSFA